MIRLGVGWRLRELVDWVVSVVSYPTRLMLCFFPTLF